MTKKIDHEYTDNIVCHYCGCIQRGIDEINGAYDEREIKIDCARCAKTFYSIASISCSFTTYKIEKEREEP